MGQREVVTLATLCLSTEGNMSGCTQDQLERGAYPANTRHHHSVGLLLIVNHLQRTMGECRATETKGFFQFEIIINILVSFFA